MFCATTFIFHCHSAQTAVGLRDVIMRLQCFAQPRRNDWQTAGNPQQRGNNHVARPRLEHTSVTFPSHGAGTDRYQLKTSL